MTDNMYLLDPAVNGDPYPYYSSLRETDRVHWNSRHRAWLITRFEDVVAAFRDPRLSIEKMDAIYSKRIGDRDEHNVKSTFDLIQDKWFGYADPPKHTRLRALVQKAFTPAVIRQLQPRIDALAAETARGVATRLKDGEELDFMAEFARPIPSVVIAEILGVPPGDRKEFRMWSDKLVLLLFGAVGEDNRELLAHEGMVALNDYFAELVRHYQRNPAPNLICELLAAEERGDALDLDEVIATCIQLLTAGDHTTASLIGNSFVALQQFPGEYDKLQASPDLVPSAVDEFLRYEGALKMTVRLPTEDLHLHGADIAAGDRVFLMLSAANRDPARFTKPDTLNVQRDEGSNVSFGHGIHHCLGSAVARLTTASAYTHLLANFPRAQIVEDLEWEPFLVTRSLKHLRVVKAGR